MEERRKYSVSDPVFFEFGSTLIDRATNDLPMFTAFDGTLNEDKLNMLETTFENAMEVAPDEVMLGLQEELTEDMRQLLAESQEIYHDVKYFSGKAYKEKPVQMRKLGLHKYGMARRKQPSMILFMNTLASTVQEVKEDLLAAGAPETLFTRLSDTAKEILRVNKLQEKSKDSRQVSTQERVIEYNKLYDEASVWTKAAERVFASDKVKRSFYVIPYSNGKGNNGKGAPPETDD